MTERNDPISFARSVLANMGHDVECGACMEVAFTGVTTNPHTCRAAADRDLAREARDKAEGRLRQELWLGHGHNSSLYGDDGEMQCIACAGFGAIDYKRDPLDKVIAAAEQARMLRVTTELTTNQRLEADLLSAREELKNLDTDYGTLLAESNAYEIALKAAREELATHCACQHDGRGELTGECQEHQRLREELATLKAESSTGIGLIAAERARQVTAEHWTAAHDDAEHADGALALAAAFLVCSPMPAAIRRPLQFAVSNWMVCLNNKVFEDRQRQLVIAGALIAAEIDRLHRENQP